MNTLKKVFLITSLVVTGLIMLILAIAISSDSETPVTTNKEITAKNDEGAWLIKSWEYGEKYPYIKDDLVIMCKDSAIWLEDIDGGKYALNGIAKSMLKNEKKYQGGTEKLLKPGKIDLLTIPEAEQRCLRVGK